MKKKTVVAVGEILWDLLPQGRQLGGAPANFAYHAHALGAESYLISSVGRDPLGEEIQKRWHEMGLPVDELSVQSQRSTGTVSVDLQLDGQPIFTIHEDVAWDHIHLCDPPPAWIRRADAIYYGSLAQRGGVSRRNIHKAIAAAPLYAMRVFDINLRQSFYTREIIHSSLQMANVLKLNDAELPVLARLYGLHGAVRDQILQLASYFNLFLVAYTRGAEGSLLYSRGEWSELPGQRIKVRDTIGAGDAFAATMTLGLLQGWSLDMIHRFADEVATYVCTQSGAMPTLPAEFRK